MSGQNETKTRLVGEMRVGELRVGKMRIYLSVSYIGPLKIEKQGFGNKLNTTCT